jgi:CHAT domain-containing protein/Flp pilus assembly protein TadD
MIATHKLFPWCLALAVFGTLMGQSLAPAADDRMDDSKFYELIHTFLERQMNSQDEAAEKALDELERYVDGPLKKEPAYKAVFLGYKAAMNTQKGRFVEAEKLFVQAFDLAEKHLPAANHYWPDGMSHFAMLYRAQGLDPDAQPRYRDATRRYQELLKGNNPEVRKAVQNFKRASGRTLKHLGMFAEAESSLLEALRMQQRQDGDAPDEVTRISSDYTKQEALLQLGDLYTAQGRYAEAEPRYLQALKVSKRSSRSEIGHAEAQVINGLATLYAVQGRYSDAEALLRRVLNGCNTEERRKYMKSLLAETFAALGSLYAVQGRYSEAESNFQEGIRLWSEMSSGKSRSFACLNGLADVYRQQGRYARAEALYKEALGATPFHYYGDMQPQMAVTLNSLAALYLDQGRYEEAAPLIERAIVSRDRAGVAAVDREVSYAIRADIHRAQKHHKEALADLRQAMNLAEEFRARISGGEQQRAAAFAGHVGVFEKMVGWQAELGNPRECLDALERSRARGLLDQIETRGLDLLAGVPEDQARKLRQREAQAQVQLAALNKQLLSLDQQKDLSDEQKKQQSDRLSGEIRQARLECVNADAAIRSASPAYRLSVGKDFKPVALDRLQSFVAGQHALLFEYLAGEKDGYVLIVPADGKARLEKLTVDAAQAKVLGVDPGPLTGRRLSAALSNGRGTGVIDRLRRADAENAARGVASALAVLWETLIPEEERRAILAGKYQRLIVLPDGPMAKLPFETLLVGAGERPKYLLDVGPAIEYAPSATILMNLAERQEQSGLKDQKDREPVLTVGDCRYGQPAQADDRDLLAQLAPPARYGTLGGRLRPLPNSAAEVRWVAKVFGEKGTKVAWLNGDMATEAIVRFNAPGRRILHFACHGLVDETYGNLFGALALTPGPNPDDPADDGFLTLAEVYGMNLKGCELAILSACDTNVGPQQRGEGIWALSRGFLVAGSRRVVASNWLVDDEAAPNFVSYFTSIIAKAEHEGKKPDYAQAVHEAKLFLRRHQNKKWHNPYYWGTFVLIGPD